MDPKTCGGCGSISNPSQQNIFRLKTPFNASGDPLLACELLHHFSVMSNGLLRNKRVRAPARLAGVPRAICGHPSGRRFRFEGAHKPRPVCSHRCNATRCHSQAQGAGRASLRPASRRRTVGTAGPADARLAGVALRNLRVGVHEAHAGIAELQHPRLHRPRRRVVDLCTASRRIQAERVAQWWMRAMDERKNSNMRRGDVAAVELWV